mgnify:CR=1 FL=1
MLAFGYTTADYMPCEIPGCHRAMVDVAHIWAKSIRKDLENNIVNLMGKCREHHTEYGDVKGETREWLQKLHNEFLKKNGVNPPAVIEDTSIRKKLYTTFKKHE